MDCIIHTSFMVLLVNKTHPFYGSIVYKTSLLWSLWCIRHTHFMVLMV